MMEDRICGSNLWGFCDKSAGGWGAAHELQECLHEMTFILHGSAHFQSASATRRPNAHAFVFVQTPVRLPQADL